jgi:hypothetical protein
MPGVDVQHSVYAIDEKMNPEAMGAFDRYYATGELAGAEKIFTAGDVDHNKRHVKTPRTKARICAPQKRVTQGGTTRVKSISYETSKFNFIHHRFKSPEHMNLWWAKFASKMGKNPNTQIEDIDPMNHKYGGFNHTFLPTTNTEGLSFWCLWETKIGFDADDVWGFAESPGGPGRVISGTDDCPFINTVFMVDEQRNPDAVGRFARYFNDANDPTHIKYDIWVSRRVQLFDN